MQDSTLPHARRRVLLWLAIIALLIIAPPLVWLGVLTVRYYGQIKGGNSISLPDQRLQASIARQIANTNVTKEDLARLIPFGRVPETGSPGAKITVIEFVDYQCPYSQRSAAPVRQVMAAMGDRVRFMIRDFPILELHPEAKQVALAANCVLEQGQEAYWRFHDLLFADQEHLTLADLYVKAQQAGVDTTKYDECVASSRYARKIEEDVKVGIRAGVQGTPTFFVNGVKFQGSLDAKMLTQILHAALSAP
jgi:protein-disulfide isomerase